MNDRFTIYYMFQQQERSVYFDNWLGVLFFIDDCDENGGFPYMIYLNGTPIYFRVLDHENGTDNWHAIGGKEVTLESEFGRTV